MRETPNDNILARMDYRTLEQQRLRRTQIQNAVVHLAAKFENNTPSNMLPSNLTASRIELHATSSMDGSEAERYEVNRGDLSPVVSGYRCTHLVKK